MIYLPWPATMDAWALYLINRNYNEQLADLKAKWETQFRQQA